MKTNVTRLGKYVTLGLGAGTVGANAATVVTFYGPGAQYPGSTPATPAGIRIGQAEGSYWMADTGYGNSSVFARDAGAVSWTGGSNLAATSGNNYGDFRRWDMFAGNIATNGAVLNSDQNFTNISFNGPDGVYEAVGQFYLSSGTDSYLVAIAMNSDNTALPIADGKAAMSAIPETSSIGLLALGAVGVLARRRRVA